MSVNLYPRRDRHAPCMARVHGQALEHEATQAGSSATTTSVIDAKSLQPGA